MSKDCEIHLPYFKQGDDLHWCLKHAPSVPEAFELHAAMLEEAAAQLRQAKSVLEKHPGSVEVAADTHMIYVEGDSAVLAELVDCGAASWVEWDDDECEDELSEEGE